MIMRSASLSSRRPHPPMAGQTSIARIGQTARASSAADRLPSANANETGWDGQLVADRPVPLTSVLRPFPAGGSRGVSGADTPDADVVIERVHIIEDDPSVRSALVNLISAGGFDAASYDSVGAFLADRGDVLAGCFLLDVRLPGLSGLEFLSEMTALDLHLPVILISGHGDVPITVQGMKAGAVDFLTKPFQPHQVLGAVSTAMDLDRARRQTQASQLDGVGRYRSLSRRERQVMGLVTAGKMNKQVAGILGLSEITVKVYRAALMRKMRVRTLADLVRISEQLATHSPELQQEST
jgi:FixJ family two-component response regulator